MATPMLEATRRCGSRVEFSATTAKTTSPGERYSTPSLRVTSLAFGGKIDETRTRFCAAIPASRSASSNEVRRSLCLPAPFVKKRRFGTIFLGNVLFLRMGAAAPDSPVKSITATETALAARLANLCCFDRIRQKRCSWARPQTSAGMRCSTSSSRFQTTGGWMQQEEEALTHLRVLFVTSLAPNQFGVYRLGALERLGLEHVVALDRDRYG